MNDFDFVPQGWECPKCKRVYSPQTMMCIACPSMTSSTTTSSVFKGDIELTCVFEPGGVTKGYFFPDFCSKCGKERQYHKYDKYNVPNK